KQAPLSWPDEQVLAGLRRPARLRVFAHVLQSMSDSDHDPMDTLARTIEVVARQPQDRGTEDAILLGAIGRGFAAMGDYGEAERYLEDACVEWQALGQYHGASRSATELLRLRALGGAAEVDRTVDRWIAPLLADPRMGGVSRAFVYGELVRAYSLTGRLALVEEYFVELEEVEAPHHVTASARRWYARALDSGGQVSKAADQRRLLNERCEEGTFERVFVLLADLDEAQLKAGAETTNLLDALQQTADDPGTLWGYEVRRLIRVICKRGLRGRDLARAVATEFRY
ncbi:MAG: hypothetical protein WCI05_19480, partial [Myxococcales bacterium]